jgi:hypothetical protein
MKWYIAQAVCLEILATTFDVMQKENALLVQELNSVCISNFVHKSKIVTLISTADIEGGIQ